MTSIVTGILSSTLGLLWNKARDTSAAKLKDGDVTDAKIREILMRELSDVKAKLDGLSRANLLSSYRFLKEGVELLNAYLDKSTIDEKAVLNKADDDCGSDKTSKIPSGAGSDILNKALELSYAVEKLKVNSDKEFESVKDRFKYARIRATDAFSNEALSIQDRIFAGKLRVVSEILECLESPERAITGCLSFLQDLHCLPAIREIFSVHLNPGIKSMLNKAERVENVKSVMLINYVLFEYVSKFSCNCPFEALASMPVVDLCDISFHPILNWQKVSTRKSLSKQLLHPPNGLILDEEVIPGLSAVNVRGEIIVGGYPNNIKTISKTGKTEVVQLPDPIEGEVNTQCIVGLAVDNDNNVYIIRRVSARTENGCVECYLLNVLDESYNVKSHCVLDFLKSSHYDWIRIAMNKINHIVMIRYEDPNVYVCDETGQLKHKFERESLEVHSLGISEHNDIMIASTSDRAVQIFTNEGDLKFVVQVPEGHEVRGVVFHHVIGKIIVLTFNTRKNSYFLISFSETGEMETSMLFCEDQNKVCVISHPSGPVAVVRHKSITFI